MLDFAAAREYDDAVELIDKARAAVERARTAIVGLPEVSRWFIDEETNPLSEAWLDAHRSGTRLEEAREQVLRAKQMHQSESRRKR